MIQSEQTSLPSEFGNFDIRVWQARRGLEPVALITKNFDPKKTVTVRIHSECLTGDVFGSLRCDCREQLLKSLSKINNSENGVCIYLRQEGRGIGLFEKIKTYQLQEKGIDTYQANRQLGHQDDERSYKEAINILKELGVKELELLTNNPQKVKELQSAEFIVNQVPLIVAPTEHNKTYLETKRTQFEFKDK